MWNWINSVSLLHTIWQFISDSQWSSPPSTLYILKRRRCNHCSQPWPSSLFHQKRNVLLKCEGRLSLHPELLCLHVCLTGKSLGCYCHWVAYIYTHTPSKKMQTQYRGIPCALYPFPSVITSCIIMVQYQNWEADTIQCVCAQREHMSLYPRETHLTAAAIQIRSCSFTQSPALYYSFLGTPSCLPPNSPRPWNHQCSPSL